MKDKPQSKVFGMFFASQNSSKPLSFDPTTMAERPQAPSEECFLTRKHIEQCEECFPWTKKNFYSAILHPLNELTI
jgi:hypothetical protein